VTSETRKNFQADITIWMDTITEGRFEDTNNIFVKPSKVDFHITEWNKKNHINIAHDIKEKYV
jgi:adenylylsulfate kinase